MALITVGIDGSAGSDHALGWAITEAQVRECDLQLAHAWMQPFAGALPGAVADSYQILERTGEELLDAAYERASRELGRPVQRVLSPDSPVHAMLALAESSDLVVVGSRGRGGFAALLLGSVSSELAHHCPCPLVIVPRPRD